jgi:hypothetical protein
MLKPLAHRPADFYVLNCRLRKHQIPRRIARSRVLSAKLAREATHRSLRSRGGALREREKANLLPFAPMDPPQSYALLMLPTGQELDHNEPFELAPDLLTWVATLPDLIHHSKLEDWAAHFGRMRWSGFVGGYRFVFCCGPDPRGEDSDKVSSHLRWRVRVAQEAMLLAPMASPFSGTVHLVSGELESLGPVRLRNIDLHMQSADVPWPSYAQESPYWASTEGEDGADFKADPWFERWVDWVRYLTKLNPMRPRILRHAFKWFKRGLADDDIESRLPEMVKALECLIALPRSSGPWDFCSRAKLIAPNVLQHPYIALAGAPQLPASHIPTGKKRREKFLQRYHDNSLTTDLDRWLVGVYGHRSDCVHGKVPFEELRETGSAREADRFNWLAENLARGAIGHVFRRQDLWPLLQTRPWN